MCEISFVFLCYSLLFFASSTNSLKNFTIDDKRDDNLMKRFQLYENSTRKNDSEADFNRYNLRKNFTIDKENAQYVFGINSKSNNRKNDDLMQNKFFAKYYEDNNNQILVELQTNFTEIDDEDHFNNENNNRNYGIVSYETCENNTCIRLCCSSDFHVFGNDNCFPEGVVFPDVRNYWSSSVQSENKKVDQVFQLSALSSLSQNPCENRTKFIKIPLNDKAIYYEYNFFENGTLYIPRFDEFVDSSYYCLTYVNHNQFDALICFESLTEVIDKEVNNLQKLKRLINGLSELALCYIIVSMLCMLIIFLVYAVLPELQNIHGFMVRRFTSVMFTFYMVKIIEIITDNEIKASICVIIALITYFCILASYFWMSIMSFDMWRTFREFSSLQKNEKQQERKKYIYSIFIWGSSFILTIICISMDYILNVPKNFRPGFGVDVCWFSSGMAEQLYCYGPISICAICSVCLFVYTGLKIMRYKKDTALHLNNLESRCYNENKKWFNLYLKLFIILCIINAINWIILTVWEFWLFKYFNFTMVYIMGSAIIIGIIRNIGILIVFVCKKTIIRSLLKRFF